LEKKVIVRVHTPDEETLKRILDMIRHIEENEEETQFEYYTPSE